jgi:hypothetical protein
VVLGKRKRKLAKRTVLLEIFKGIITRAARDPVISRVALS